MPCMSGYEHDYSLRDVNNYKKMLAEREAMLCAILSELKNHFRKNDILGDFHEFLMSAEKNGQYESDEFPSITDFYKAHINKDKERLAKKLKETFSDHEQQMIAEIVVEKTFSAHEQQIAEMVGEGMI